MVSRQEKIDIVRGIIDQFSKFEDKSLAPMFALVGGYVCSNDGDRHYISENMLVNLYCLNRAECILINGNDLKLEHIVKRLPKNTIVLPVRDGGDYIDFILFAIKEYYKEILFKD